MKNVRPLICACCILAAVYAVAPVPALAAFGPLTNWYLGDGGYADEIAVGPRGDVYVTSSGHDGIRRFGANGARLNRWSPGRYDTTGLAVDGAGYVYVLDHRVTKFSPSGSFVSRWIVPTWGDERLEGIAVDPQGNIYVANIDRNRIEKISSTGTLLTSWGGAGTGDGQFKYPSSIAVDSSANVYVADAWLDRVQKFSSDGALLAKWGTTGTGPGQLRLPKGIGVDGAGAVYVADSRNRVQRFTADGSFIESFGRGGACLGELGDPLGLATSAGGDVYVSDQGGRVHRFGQRPTGDALAPTVSSASVSPKRIRAPRKRPTLSRASKRRRGHPKLTTRYTLSERASVCMTIEGLARRAAEDEEPPFVLDFPLPGRQGTNRYRSALHRFFFSLLPSGRYAARLVATDAAGNESAPARAYFRIVRSR
jgi:DNA-binding beta-propeller fold protein YncE